MGFRVAARCHCGPVQDVAPLEFQPVNDLQPSVNRSPLVVHHITFDVDTFDAQTSKVFNADNLKLANTGWRLHLDNIAFVLTNQRARDWTRH
jgi:hypothetical protein